MTVVQPVSAALAPPRRRTTPEKRRRALQMLLNYRRFTEDAEGQGAGSLVEAIVTLMNGGRESEARRHLRCHNAVVRHAVPGTYRERLNHLISSIERSLA